MELFINTPEKLINERIKLLDQCLELLRSQERSSLRYAIKLRALRNKIEEINKQLGG